MSSPATSRRRSVALLGLPLVAALTIAAILVVVTRARDDSSGSAAAGDPVIATVAGTSLHRSDLDRRVAVASTAALQGGAPPSSDPSYPAFLSKLRAQALKSLITDTVIAGEARARGVAASDADVQREVDGDAAGVGGTAVLQSQLAEAGSSIDTLRDETRARLNEAQLEDYFAGQRAADIISQLQQGKDFGDLARAYSDDLTSRDKGGDLGDLSLDQLKAGDSAFYNAVTTIPPGSTSSKAVRDTAGYEILLVDSAAATTRHVHRILVQAPQPYTARERPDWFTASVLQALADECAAGRIQVLIADAGQPCGLATASPSAGGAAAAPTSPGAQSPSSAAPTGSAGVSPRAAAAGATPAG